MDPVDHRDANSVRRNGDPNGRGIVVCIDEVAGTISDNLVDSLGADRAAGHWTRRGAGVGWRNRGCRVGRGHRFHTDRARHVSCRDSAVRRSWPQVAEVLGRPVACGIVSVGSAWLVAQWLASHGYGYFWQLIVTAVIATLLNLLLARVWMRPVWDDLWVRLRNLMPQARTPEPRSNRELLRISAPRCRGNRRPRIGQNGLQFASENDSCLARSRKTICRRLRQNNSRRKTLRIARREF